jgi:hypothetical protein
LYFTTLFTKRTTIGCIYDELQCCKSASVMQVCEFVHASMWVCACMRSCSFNVHVCKSSLVSAFFCTLLFFNDRVFHRRAPRHRTRERETFRWAPSRASTSVANRPSCYVPLSQAQTPACWDTVCRVRARSRTIRTKCPRLWQMP